MNLHHLKTFYLTAKYLSVSQAAREMKIAQPAATRHLKELQSGIDIVLFNNRGKKLYLTNEGRILFEKTKKIFTVETEVENAIEEIKRFRSGLLSLSTQATFGDYYLPSVLLEFYRKYPDITMTVYTFLSDTEIISSIEKMEADIGISSVKPESAAIKSQKIFTAKQYLVVSHSHRLSGEKIIRPEMLEGEIFIMPEKSSRSRKLIDNYFKAESVNAKVLYELGHTIPIINMVKNGVGISITYREAAAGSCENGDICMIPVYDPDNLLSRDFYMIYSREKYKSEIIAKFIDCLKTWAENIK